MITLDPKQILLFPETEEDFENNGIGHLSDAISCIVTEELNGIFELELVYPISGNHYADIGQRSIIYCKARPNDLGQPFRVYRITKPLNGIVTVYAEHISYDLSGIVDEPFTAGSASAAMSALETHAVGTMPFAFWTDKSTSATMTVEVPSSVRSLLGGSAGSVLDVYGGEWEFDRFAAKLHNHRGQNRGFSIRYGKNLTDIQQEENCSNCYTAVYPYWKSTDGDMVTLTEKTVPVTGTFSYTKVLVHDFSQDFEEQPTKAQLKTKTQDYIAANNIGVPKVSIDVSFVQLSKAEEYKSQAMLEQLYLGDTVSVEFEKLGVSALAKVNKTVFNALLDRYDTVSVGDAKTTIADTIAVQQAEIDAVNFTEVMSEVEAAALEASKLITGNKGGYVVIHSSTGSDTPNEILIMDTPNIQTAQKVWRWNNSGLGYSSTGYNGTFTTAWTIAGAFNADFITAGTMTANRIRGGMLESTDGTTAFDLAEGELKINLTADGKKYMLLSAHGIEFYRNYGNSLEARFTDSDLTSADSHSIVQADVIATFGNNDNNAVIRHSVNDGRIVEAETFIFNGPTVGLLDNSEELYNDECNAYVVVAQINRYMSIFVPSNISNVTWRMTDGDEHLDFKITNGSATKTGGTGTIIDTYALR